VDRQCEKRLSSTKNEEKRWTTAETEGSGGDRLTVEKLEIGDPYTELPSIQKT